MGQNEAAQADYLVALRRGGDELPLIPVLYYTQQTAVSARVQGFSFDPYERNYRIAEMSFSPCCN